MTYRLDIKNPYLSKGNFLWKHNSDKTLGEKPSKEEFEEYKKQEMKKFADDFDKTTLPARPPMDKNGRFIRDTDRMGKMRGPRFRRKK